MLSSRSYNRPAVAGNKNVTKMSAEIKTAWRKVNKHPPFPILEETREALRLAFNRRFVSHAQLESIVESDPALCWHLANNATRKNPHCREQLNGAVSCLSLLGMQEAIYVAKRLDVVSNKETDLGRRYYRQSLLTGHFAALFAKKLCQSMTLDSRQQQLYFWATSLAQSVLWPWWQTYDDMPRWLMRMAMGQDPLKGLIKLLGSDWSLWQPLARKGVLPDLALAAVNPSNFPNSAEWQLLRCKNPRALIRTGRSNRLGRVSANQNHPLDPRVLMHKCQSGSLIILCATMIAWLCYTRPSGHRLQRWLIIAANASGQRPQDVLQQLRDSQRQLIIYPEYQQTIGWDLCAGTEPLMRRISGFSNIQSDAINNQKTDTTNNHQTVEGDSRQKEFEHLPPQVNKDISTDDLISQLPTSLQPIASHLFPPKEKDSLRCLMQQLIDCLQKNLPIDDAQLWLIDKKREKLNKVYCGEKDLNQSDLNNRQQYDDMDYFNLSCHPELAQWFNTEQNLSIATPAITTSKIAADRKIKTTELVFPIGENCQINPLVIDGRAIAIVVSQNLALSADYDDNQRIINHMCQITSAGLEIVHQRLYAIPDTSPDHDADPSPGCDSTS